MEFKHGKITQ